MTAEVLDTSVGQQMWYAGAAWTVVELDGMNVVLRSAERLVRVHAPALVGLASSLSTSSQPTERAELDAVRLGSLTTKQRSAIEREAEVYERLIASSSEKSVNDRYEAAADELGIAVRTAYRRGQRYLDCGVVGLLDSRLLKKRTSVVSPEWDLACRESLASFRDKSNPTRGTVIAKANALFLNLHPDGAVPSRAVAYKRLRELDKGRYTFGAAKQRRSVAERPQGVMGRLRADRPGQYVVLDTTRLDVFAMEPLTNRWVNTELTVAMDLYSRCILGLALRPISTKSHDVAAVLYQVVTPQTWGPVSEIGEGRGPYAGVPESILTQDTGALPDTIVVDHGKVYLSHHTRSVCQRLGINIQPAIPHKPTDKPTIERFFRTLRQQLLEHLPAYKGPDIYSRGKNVEREAFYFVSDLEAIIREWVGIYHHSPHQGLCDPILPNVELSPTEMFARGISAAGLLRLPSSDDLRMEFLDVAWRTIQHYGVEVDGRRYDGSGLNLYRMTKSAHGGAHAGKWPIMVDRDDVRAVYFQDPATLTWHSLAWEHASGLESPLSAEAADYTRELSRHTDRHVDASVALDDLLHRYSKKEVTSRREKNVAQRLAASTSDHRVQLDSSESDIPDVIDLAAHLRNRGSRNVVDDLDVFDQYYANHPDGEAFQVFDE